VSPFRKITLVGVGLLGGSLGLAIRRGGLACTVHGLVRRRESVNECRSLGVVDEATQDPLAAVAGADLVVLCLPIAKMKESFAQLRPALEPGAIVTDVGSVKRSVVEELEGGVIAAGGHFVGSHPMAGAEKTGPAAARADLFEDAVCVVTPTPRSSAEAVSRIESFWSDVGACPIRMSPELHDDLVSRSSHLPHVVAAELANYVLSPTHPREQASVCANGFRDTTRIASSSPEMWRDIALANHENLARVLGVFIEDLQEFQLALKNQDRKAIEEFFEKAKQRRDAWSERAVSPSPE